MERSSSDPSSDQIDKSQACLVCGKFSDVETYHDISSSYSITTLSQVHMTDIISTVLGSVLVHSMLLCQTCWQLLDMLDTLQVQVKLKKSEITVLYENSNIGKGKSNTSNYITNPKQTDSKPSKEDFVPHLFPQSGMNTTDMKTETNPPTTIDTSCLSLQAPEEGAENHATQDIELVEPPKKRDKGLLTSTDLKCQVCGKTFEKRRYLMDHLRRVHNSAIHQCQGCKVRYKYKDELVTHQRSCDAHKDKEIKEKLKETVEPQNNKLFTKRKKNNKCAQCDGYFLTQALLKTHIRTIHEKQPHDENEEIDETKVENPVTCNLCNITINNEYALSIHQGSVHGFEKPWGCNTCGKNFARHLELVNHKRIHSGDKPFQCDFCGARFNQKQNLHTHVRHIHLGERRYSCNICSMKFRRKRLLDCHMNSKHKFERPYVCKVCPASFVYPEHVRKHELSHTDDKKHKCTECEKTFKSKSSLDNHSACHRPSSNYQCLSCPQYFLSKDLLLDHLKSSNHPRGVFSSQNKDVLIPLEAETLSLSFMDSVENPPAQTESVYEDVVFYLSDQNIETIFTEDGQAVFVTDTGADEVHKHDEIQTAISSIVEVGESTEDIHGSGMILH